MDETANEWGLEAQTEGISSAELRRSLPQPLPPSLVSDKIGLLKLLCKHRKASASNVRDQTRKAKPNDRFSTASSDYDTRVTSSDHYSPFSDLSKSSLQRTSASAIHSDGTAAATLTNRKTSPQPIGWLPYLFSCYSFLLLRRESFEQ